MPGQQVLGRALGPPLGEGSKAFATRGRLRTLGDDGWLGAGGRLGKAVGAEPRGGWQGRFGSVGTAGETALWIQVGFVMRFVGYVGRRVRGAVGSVGSWVLLGFLESLRSVVIVESGGPGCLPGLLGESNL